MDVDSTGLGTDPRQSPPQSPHAPTEVPEREGERADYDVDDAEAGEVHVVGANPDVHPWGPPLTDEDDDDETTLPMATGAGEDMEDEVPLDSLTLQEAPNPVSSKRDITQVGLVRKSPNPAAYPQWTKGSAANKIGGAGDKNHLDWHHPSNNQSPDPASGAASSGTRAGAARPVRPIYSAGQ
eukprot:2551216-Amphidinium_carterae.1